jgi:PAS domain S-box-containing protein
MNTSIDLAALVAAVGDAVMVCDANGAIVLWNPACERMFGHTEAEALGQSMDLIIPERLRKRHWEGYDKTMATGITKYGHDVLRVPAVDKQGNSLSIAFTVAMLYGEDGKVSAIASIIRDETVRFNDERALKKRVAELEAQLAAKA